MRLRKLVASIRRDYEENDIAAALCNEITLPEWAAKEERTNSVLIWDSEKGKHFDHEIFQA